MKFFLWLLFIMISVEAKEITIAVAANVSYAIEPLIHTFQIKYPDIKVNTTIGSSGKLTAQIIHGAPYGLLMSANIDYPERLYRQGLTQEKPVIYAYGALALLSTHKHNNSLGLALLTDKEIKKIAIANPKTAPYGVATVEALKHAKLYQVLTRKFVYGESIGQTVIYATQVADIGIVSKSSLYSPKLSHYKQGKDWVEVPKALYTPISQGMVRLNSTPEIKYFYDFICSADAKKILKAYGYEVK